MNESELTATGHVADGTWNDTGAAGSSDPDGGLLIVDDDGAWSRAMMAEAERMKRRCVHVADAKTALLLVLKLGCKTGIVEPNVPGSSWVHFVRELRRRLPAGTLIAATSFPSRAMEAETRALGMSYIAKRTCRPSDLLQPRLHRPEGVYPNADGMSDLHQVNWEHVNAVLVKCNGNVSATARELGISRRGLYYKLRTLPPGP